MKLSESTMKALDKFSKINNKLMLREGNQQCIASISRSLFAVATLTESFSTRTGINDLPKVVDCIKLIKDYDISFEDNSFIISNDNCSALFVNDINNDEISEINPNKLISLDYELASIPISYDTLKAVMDYSKLMRVSKIKKSLNKSFGKTYSNLFLEFTGTEIFAVAQEDTTYRNQFFKVRLGTSDKKMRLMISLEDLELIDTDSVFDLNSKVCRITSKSDPITYYTSVTVLSDE